MKIQEKGAYPALLGAASHFVTDQMTIEAVAEVLRFQAAFRGGAVALAHGQMVDALTKAFGAAGTTPGLSVLTTIVKVRTPICRLAACFRGS